MQKTLLVICSWLFVAGCCWGQSTDTLAYDSFTGSNGTALTSHSMDIEPGSGWVDVSPSPVTIQSNRAEVAASGEAFAGDHHYVDIGQSTNYFASLKFQGTDVNGDSFGLLVRGSNDTNPYGIIYFTTLNRFDILRNINQAQLATLPYTHSTSVWYRIEVYCLDDTIRASLYDNDQDTLVGTIEAIDSDVSGNRVGLLLYGGNFLNEHADDFLVLDLSSLEFSFNPAAVGNRRGKLRRVTY